MGHKPHVVFSLSEFERLTLEERAEYLTAIVREAAKKHARPLAETSMRPADEDASPRPRSVASS